MNMQYMKIILSVILLSTMAKAVLSSPTQIKITPSTTPNDYVGYSVSISGDTALVGANGDSGSKGAVYVYTRSGTSWTKEANLTASDGATADYFGWSVALENDTAVVGAIGDSGEGEYTGSAYIFTRSGSTWAQVAKLTTDDSAAYDQEGYAVAISGDTVLIGANYNEQEGAAYIFVKPGTGWTDMNQTAKLTAADGTDYDDFGCSVSLSGDTALIGADEKGNYNGSAYIFDKGSAYIFEKPGTGWTDMNQTAKLTASDGAADDAFGSFVSISGNAAAIGAAGDNNGSGSAYVYTRSGNSWVEQNKLIASDGNATDDFGISVALNGDTVLVGADGDDTYTGSAYMNRYECGFTASVIKDQWSMIGIPCDLGSSDSVTNVFGDNFTIGDYYSTWILYKWNRETESYTYLTPTDTISHNEGYWLIKTDSNGTWDASGTLTTNSGSTAGCPSGMTCISLPLTSSASATESRFNLVGHPQNVTGKWADVHFYDETTSTTYTPDEAQDANVTSGTFWKYNGGSYDPYDDGTPGMEGSLNSHEGFWVKMLGDSHGHTVKIVIPYGE
jgi:hypothetical protein